VISPDAFGGALTVASLAASLGVGAVVDEQMARARPPV
jgi:hypothetical protein